jgi:vacuolar-type H+-ATPase subunit I/STV1
MWMDFQQTNRLAAMFAIALILSASVPAAFSQSNARKSSRKRSAAPTTKTKVTIPPPVGEAEQKDLAETIIQSWTNLIATSNTYRESLERILELQKQDEARAAESVEKRKTLLDLGVISKRELEEGEQALGAAQARMSEMRKQIEEVDRLVAEVNAAEQLDGMPPEPQGSFRTAGALIRYVGAILWDLSDFGKVDAFFRLKFSKPLPVSAIGQTETHNRLGFDHREAIDVAVHPDSAEGQALINYLRGQGISFIAIRYPIPGSATGAHIHIGPSSKRIVLRQIKITGKEVSLNRMTRTKSPKSAKILIFTNNLFRDC